MKNLSNNTLKDIAKHSNKALNLAQLVVEADFPFIPKEVMQLDLSATEIDILEAFQKDVAGTVKQLEDIHRLLATVDDNGVVHKLDNDERDLNNLFGSAFNHSEKIIKAKSFELHLGKDYDPQKEFIRHNILKTVLGEDASKFDEIFKNRKAIFELNEDSLKNDFERISYLSSIKSRDISAGVIKSINKTISDFVSFRSKLGRESRKLVDEKIVGGRTMIDGVLKNSTYINEEEGIVQVAASHKKQTEKLNDLSNLINESEFFYAIELDKDASIDSVIDAIKSMDGLRADLGRKMEIKVRKLGNYRANGLYIDAYNTVACDVEKPSALLHELAHAADISNSELFYSEDRRMFVNYFREKIDPELLHGKPDYWLNDKEIVARANEVSYLLNSHDYNPEEDFESFVKRVKDAQKNHDPDNISLIKPIELYVEDTFLKNVYFRLAERTPEELQVIKEFGQMFFGVGNKQIATIAPMALPKMVREAQKRKIVRAEPRAVGGFNAQNVERAFEYNKTKNIIGEDVLIDELLKNPTFIARNGARGTPVQKFPSKSGLNSKQIDTLKKAVDWVAENGQIKSKSQLVQSGIDIYILQPSQIDDRMTLETAIETGIGLNFIDEVVKRNEAKNRELMEEGVEILTMSRKRGMTQTQKHDLYDKRRKNQYAIDHNRSDIVESIIKENADVFKLYSSLNGTGKRIQQTARIADLEKGRIASTFGESYFRRAYGSAVVGGLEEVLKNNDFLELAAESGNSFSLAHSVVASKYDKHIEEKSKILASMFSYLDKENLDYRNMIVKVDSIRDSAVRSFGASYLGTTVKDIEALSRGQEMHAPILKEDTSSLKRSCISFVQDKFGEEVALQVQEYAETHGKFDFRGKFEKVPMYIAEISDLREEKEARLKEQERKKAFLSQKTKAAKLESLSEDAKKPEEGNNKPKNKRSRGGDGQMTLF